MSLALVNNLSAGALVQHSLARIGSAQLSKHAVCCEGECCRCSWLSRRGRKADRGLCLSLNSPAPPQTGWLAALSFSNKILNGGSPVAHFITGNFRVTDLIPTEKKQSKKKILTLWRNTYKLVLMVWIAHKETSHLSIIHTFFLSHYVNSSWVLVTDTFMPPSPSPRSLNAPCLLSQFHTCLFFLSRQRKGRLKLMFGSALPPDLMYGCRRQRGLCGETWETQGSPTGRGLHCLNHRRGHLFKTGPRAV